MINKIYILRRLLKYASPVISIFEKKKIMAYSAKKAAYEPVFIIGTPRSGSTILFQVLTNYLDVSYITNLVNLAKKNPFFGFYLNEKINKNEPHNTFNSSFGKTDSQNFNAPNEGLFWYKWLKKGEYYSDENSLNKSQKKEFRDTIYAIINKYHKPFLIKNLSFSVRIKLLHNIFPNAKYIYIKREQAFIAQSIIMAKRKLNIPDDAIWSVKPENFAEFEKAGLIKQVVNQVVSIENQINTDKKLIDKSNFLEINYSDLCNNTNNTVTLIKDFINAEKITTTKKIKNLNIRDKIKIEKKSFTEIENEINKINYNNEQ
ncbi:MAG: sulfotransferase [Bacteroidales bacterium]|nr:sulfotransferase [Bacteroidales bacterium]